MKLFTKISLGIAVFFTGVAIICSLIALAMGFSARDFIKMAQDGKFSIQVEDGKIEIFGYKTNQIFELDWDFFDDKDENELTFVDGQTYDVVGEYENLEAKFGAGHLEIYYDDVENIQIKKEDVAGFELKTDEGKKTISIEGGLYSNMDDGATLIIIVPREYLFQNVELEIGASQANISDLCASYMDITIGAGQANINDLDAEKIELEVGAGQAMLKGLEIKNIEVEAGLGQVDIEIAGSEKDYCYNVNCGIGNVVIGNRSFGGIGANQSIQQDGAVGKIEVECGIGEVVIRFMEEKNVSE